MAHPEAGLAAPPSGPGPAPPVTGSCATQHQLGSRWQHTGRSKLPIWRRPTRSTPSTRRVTTARAATIALLEMAGAGYSAERHQHLRQLLRDHARLLGRSRRRMSSTAAVPIRGGTAEAELDIETALSLAPQANIEVYEGGLGQPLRRLQPRSSATTPPRSSAPAGRTAARPTSANASRARRTRYSRRPRRRPVDLRGHRGPGRSRAATSTARSTPRPVPPRGPGRRSVDRDPVRRQPGRATP